MRKTAWFLLRGFIINLNSSNFYAEFRRLKGEALKDNLQGSYLIKNKDKGSPKKVRMCHIERSMSLPRNYDLQGTSRTS